jgi:hypothetical protein
MKGLVSTLMLVPATALAGTAFDGTWKANQESFKTSGKPDVYLLADGEYTCSSCSPELKVKADGADHKVSGHAYYDTAMVKVTGPNSDEQVLKQGGKPAMRVVESVSADGNTLTTKITSYAGQQPARRSGACRLASGLGLLAAGGIQGRRHRAHGQVPDDR